MNEILFSGEQSDVEKLFSFNPIRFRTTQKFHAYCPYINR